MMANAICCHVFSSTECEMFFQVFNVREPLVQRSILDHIAIVIKYEIHDGC